MKFYYLLASLPALSPSFGSEPPIGVAAFWRKIEEDAPALRELVHAALLARDVANIEQIYARQDPALAGTIPLEFLKRVVQDPAVRSRYIPEGWDLAETWKPQLWERYFAHAGEVARKHGSSLSEWLSWELALRRAFERSRSEKTGRGKHSGVSVETDSYPEQQRLVDAYGKAPNPWEAEQALDRARWEKIDTLAVPYSFGKDELVRYLLHLLILERWWSLSSAKEEIPLG